MGESWTVSVPFPKRIHVIYTIFSGFKLPPQLHGLPASVLSSVRLPFLRRVVPRLLLLLLQSCPTLCGPVDCSPSGSSVHGIVPGKSAGVGYHTLLQGIFPSQESNPHLLYLISYIFTTSAINTGFIKSLANSKIFIALTYTGYKIQELNYVLMCIKGL